MELVMIQVNVEEDRETTMARFMNDLKWYNLYYGAVSLCGDGGDGVYGCEGGEIT